MMKEARTLKRSGGIVHIRNRGVELIESRWNLRHLIYWMENDRSLDAQEDKIFHLKKLLADIEERMGKRQRLRTRSAIG